MTKTIKAYWRGKAWDLPVWDTQRKKVYEAERAAFVGPAAGESYGWGCLYRDGDLGEIRKLVKKITASATWKKLLADAGTRSVTIEIADGRGTRAARGGHGFLNLPRWARTLPVILHELAHVSAPWAGHHWPFAAAYLTLVARFLGAAERDALKAAFKAHRVRFTPPRQISPERLAQLRALGTRLAAARRMTPSPLPPAAPGSETGGGTA